MITLVYRFLGAIAIFALPVFLCGCNNAQSMPVAAPLSAIQSAAAGSGLTAKIKTALMATDGVDNLDIRIRTQRDEVMLSGFADSRAQIDRSIEVVKRVAGVGKVINRIRIREFT